MTTFTVAGTLYRELTLCTGICALHRMRSAIYGWNEPGSKIDAVCQLFVYVRVLALRV